MYQLFRDRPLLVLILVMGNLALCLWAYLLDPVINNDAVTYLALADMILDGNVNAALNYYSWPFYSAFIASVAFITQLSTEHSAYILNALFLISLSWAFICIVADLSDNDQRIVLFALLVILLFPSITKYRSFIIRDFGYLSCYLWSLFFLLRFCRTSEKSHFTWWLLFTAASCLFRFEGVAFLLVTPYFLYLFKTGKTRRQKINVILLTLAVLAASLSLFFWYINDKYAAIIDLARREGQDIHTVFDLFLANTKEKLGGNDLSTLNYLGLIFNNFGNVSYELLRRMGIFYLLFALYAYYKNLGLSHTLSRQIWLALVLTNISILVVFGLYNTFLASRYTMASALTLLILTPFVIDKIITGFSYINSWKKVSSAVAIMVLCLVSIEGLDVRTNKRHLRLAADWMSENLADDATIYSNNRQLIHYTSQTTDKKLDHAYDNLQLYYYLNHGILRSFDYIALSYNEKSKSEDTYRQTLAFKFGAPINITSGKKGQHVLVFELPNAKES